MSCSGWRRDEELSFCAQNTASFNSFSVYFLLFCSLFTELNAASQTTSHHLLMVCHAVHIVLLVLLWSQNVMLQHLRSASPVQQTLTLLNPTSGPLAYHVRLNVERRSSSKQHAVPLQTLRVNVLPIRTGTLTC